jgi:hypothetical protein
VCSGAAVDTMVRWEVPTANQGFQPHLSNPYLVSVLLLF